MYFVIVKKKINYKIKRQTETISWQYKILYTNDNETISIFIIIIA